MGTETELALRDYQERSLESVYRFLRTESTNPVIVIPTGGGKTPIIARICSDAVKLWEGRVIVLSHVKELLEQSLSHIQRDAPGLEVGIYSAGLGSKDTHQPVIVAGIQSACRNPDAFEPPNLIIIDEAHRIPPEGEGQYRTFISAMQAKNPELRVIGLTATPYRTGTGMIVGPDNILNKICFEVSVRELINAKWLSPLVCRGGTEKIDFSKITVRQGEFAADEMEALMLDHVGLACSDILTRASDRKSILIFAAGVEHGQMISRIIGEQTGEEVGEVYGDTPDEKRSSYISRFKSGQLRWLVNCNVLTLGFDAPNVDCVAIVRATMSPGLYYQMCGRGFRIAEGKVDCLILDFGSNVMRHGPVDTLAPDGKKPSGNGQAPAKPCPEEEGGCGALIHAAYMTCPHCSYQFPKKEPKHDGQSSDGTIISQSREVEVESVSYSLHTGKESGIYSLRVSYSTGISQVSEFVCLEHEGYAREKAFAWWSKRGEKPIPETIDEALARTDELKEPTGLLVNFGGKYPNILAYRF